MMDTSSYPELDETEITRQAELERFKVFNERATTGAYGSLLAIGLLGWVLVQAVGWQRALVWCCFVGTVELGISLNGWRGRRSLASGSSNAQILYAHHLLAGLAGVAWGSVVYFIWTGGDLMAYLATLAILVGVSGVSMVTLSSYAVPATLFLSAFTSCRCYTSFCIPSRFLSKWGSDCWPLWWCSSGTPASWARSS